MLVPGSYVIVVPDDDQGLRLYGRFPSLRAAEGVLAAYSWEFPDAYALPVFSEQALREAVDKATTNKDTP